MKSNDQKTPLPWRDGESRYVGNIKWQRVAHLDKRIGHGDDFAGDAFVRWVAVGQQPDDPLHVVRERLSEFIELLRLHLQKMKEPRP